jgi:hypothetical protein
MQELKGRAAIVIGAASGIGSDIATAPARAVAEPDLRLGRDALGTLRRPLRPPATGGVARRDGTRGVAPDAAGERVLHAIQHNEFHVLTHATEPQAVKARHERIDAAFDRAAAWDRR